MRRLPLIVTVAACVVAAVSFVSATAGVAVAHPGHGGHFEDGFRHPLLGLDHLLAMIAVGLLAVRIGGKALWLTPTMFLTAIVGGGIVASSRSFATASFANNFVQFGVACSVLGLGLLIAMRKDIRLVFGLGLVALFGSFHGFAHIAGSGMGSGAGSIVAPYSAGFLAATALLHIAGIAAGILLAKVSRRHSWQLTGASCCVLGTLMLLGIV